MPCPLPDTRYFSDDYATARERFLRAAKVPNADRYKLPLDVTAPDGTALSIVIAWLGSPSPENVVIHSSGATCRARRESRRC